jgi:hypothetical protein
MTPDAQELFLRESDLLSPDKNMFHTILTEIFSTVLSRTVSAMFTSEAQVNLLCTTWDCQMETLFTIVSRIRELEFYAFYAFYAWWIHFPQLGALAEGTSLPTSRKRDQA